MKSLTPSDKSRIKKILVVSLSNLGDVILTFPVIDILLQDFPGVPLSVVVGPKGKELFQSNPLIERVYVFEKKSSALEKMRWVNNLKKERFDLVVDLRNTAIPLFVNAKFRTTYRDGVDKNLHKLQKHLKRLRSVWHFIEERRNRRAIYITGRDKSCVDALLKEGRLLNRPFVMVAPGAANHIKRWREEGFAAIADELITRHVNVVFVGDRNDKPVVLSIINRMRNPAFDATGKTTMLQLAELIHRSLLVIANDSAVMHLASYLDKPTIAIFGPTDESKYGPWSSRSRVVRKKLFCTPCEKSGCAYHHECMNELAVADVWEAIRSGFLNL